MTFLAASISATPIEPNPWMILPFVVMLLSIAFMPFIHLHWWEKNYPKVAVGLGAVAVTYYLVFLGQPGRVAEVAHEYLSFIALIGSLFVVAGGVHIRVRGEATPLRNTIFLGIGAVIANFIGTTGASMLMIRPWIRMNKYRITAFHVVFFIFIVSNVGGALTPIGDPPLFLGYLKGVPFFWTAEYLWMPWLVMVGLLLIVFFVTDTFNFRRAPEVVRELETAHEKFRIDGKRNFFFIAVILAAVFMPVPWREVVMIGAALASWYFTPKQVHEMNHFNLHPVKEVAWLFFGIFGTMIPALDYLQLHSNALGVETPLQVYAFTGILSAVLDNAPTYLTFLAAALGQKGLSLGDPADVAAFAYSHTPILVAISLGAVFFGAATYIGNGPNFMVKAIAQHAKVETPSFFGYVLRFSIPVLLPILILVGWLFFT
ncbi:MAG: sodium:proton antiporter [Chthoniobacterales bacterium]